MFKIGDKVRLTKATRHGMVAKGQVGTVVEIREEGNTYTDGIVVEFMVAPSPAIARMFGKTPGVAEPFRCLFPLFDRYTKKGKKPPFVPA